MGGRDHSCEVCGQGGFNGGECVCTSEEDARRATYSESQGRELREQARRLLGEREHPMFRVEADGRIEQVRCENCDSLSAQLVEAREALEDLTAIIEAADRIDSLDHRLQDGRVIDGKIAVGGTQIQVECQAIRTHVRAASALLSSPSTESE